MRYVMLGFVCMLAVAFLCCCQPLKADVQPPVVQQANANYGEKLPVFETTTVQVAVVPVVATVGVHPRVTVLAATDATFVNQTVNVPGGCAAGVCSAAVPRPVQFARKIVQTLTPKGRIVRKVQNRNRVWKFPLLGLLKRN